LSKFWIIHFFFVILQRLVLIYENTIKMAYKDQCGVEYSDDLSRLEKAPSDLKGEYIIMGGTQSIERSAFDGCSQLTSLYIPSSLKTIGSLAFNKCSSLEKICYEGGINGWLALDMTCSFTRSYDLYFGDTIVNQVEIPIFFNIIKPNAFYYCRSVKKVTFHGNIVEIGANAFNKSGLSGVLTLPEGLVSVKQLAFYNCVELTGVKIPSTLTDFWYGAISCCGKLKNIAVASNNPKLKVVPGILYDIDGVMKAVAPCATSDILTIPSCIRSIAKNTFCYGSVPQSGIRLTTTLERLSDEAFLKVKDMPVYVPVGKKQYYVNLGIDRELIREEFNINTAFIEGHNHISAISENPFRILGVYANATQKEITANARKIKRFIEVGQEVEFETDFNNFLPKISRTLESVDNALAKLTNQQERCLNSLFWFTNYSDSLCLERLRHGSVDSAINFWSEHLSETSAANLSTISFITNHFEDAVDGITTFIHEGPFFEEFCHIICGEEFEIDEDKISRDFIDTLLNDISLPECKALYLRHGSSVEDDNYLEQLLIEKYDNFIKDAIAVAKNSDKSNPQEVLDVTRTLMNSTRDILKEFAAYVGEDNTEYCMTADRLANQILQGSIDFYNEAIDRYAALDAMELAQYALSIVKGQVKRQRCEENISILQKIVDKIPPREFEHEDEALCSVIRKHTNDAGTLANVWQILEDCANGIAELKALIYSDEEVQDFEHKEKYLESISSELLNLALNKLIDAVNGAKGIAQLSTVNEAWDIMLNMDEFPMSFDFYENRYKGNRDTLEKLRSFDGHLSVPTSPKRTVELKTSEEIWGECTTIEDYLDYIERFPNGKHIRAAKNRISELKRAADDRAFARCKTDDDYDEYLENYPNGLHTNEAKQKAEEYREREKTYWETCKGVAALRQYVKVYPNGTYKKAAEEQIKKIESQAKLLKWMIAIESYIIFLLIIYLLATRSVFYGFMVAGLIGFVLIGLIVAANQSNS